MFISTPIFQVSFIYFSSLNSLEIRLHWITKKAVRSNFECKLSVGFQERHEPTTGIIDWWLLLMDRDKSTIELLFTHLEHLLAFFSLYRLLLLWEKYNSSFKTITSGPSAGRVYGTLYPFTRPFRCHLLLSKQSKKWRLSVLAEGLHNRWLSALFQGNNYIAPLWQKWSKWHFHGQNRVWFLSLFNLLKSFTHVLSHVTFIHNITWINKYW